MDLIKLILYMKCNITSAYGAGLRTALEHCRTTGDDGVQGWCRQGTGLGVGEVTYDLQHEAGASCRCP